MSHQSFKKLLEEAKKLIKEEKEIMKTVYQLAFIATSNSPRAEEALRLMELMAASGIISPKQITKAIEDVKRWRRIRLDLGKMEFEFGSPDKGDTQ